MAIKTTEYRFPTVVGGHSGSGGRGEWWYTDSAKSVGEDYSTQIGQLGSLLTGTSHWLYSQGYNFSLPDAGAVVTKVRGKVRLRRSAGDVRFNSAVLRIKTVPGISFPEHTIIKDSSAIGTEWADKVFEWPASVLDPATADDHDAERAVVARSDFGFAFTISATAGNVQIEHVQMQVEYDDGFEVEPPVTDEDLEILRSAVARLDDVQVTLKKLEPLILQVDTVLGDIERYLDSKSAEPAPTE